MLSSLMTLISGTLSEPIQVNCGIKKIRVTGAQHYDGYNPSRAVMKSLGHFNGVYEIDSDLTNGHPSWTKLRPDSRSVTIQWVDDIFGATGWVITNNPGQPRFYSYSINDCPTELHNWQLLEYGNKTVLGDEKPADKLGFESLGDFKPIPSWVLAQLDDQEEQKGFQTLKPEQIAVEDIFTMLAHVVPDKQTNLQTYGCNGISDLRLFTTPGIKVDKVSEAIDEWKKCILCSQDFLGATFDPYIFDSDKNICLNTAGNIERAMCDCDYAFAKKVKNMEVGAYTLTSKDCVLKSTIRVSRPEKCCFDGETDLFVQYDVRKNCCSNSGLLQPKDSC